MVTCGICFNDEDALHAPPSQNGRDKEHMERPERTRVIWDGLLKSGLAKRCRRIPVREVTREEAMLCHSSEHCDALEALETSAPAIRGAWIGEGHTPQGGVPLVRYGWAVGGHDMYHSEHTPRAVRLAAGGVLALAQHVCSRELDSGFAIVRPPGHHACSDKMCGFCFLNSAAIAAKYAVQKLKVARVLLLDWDVHHGNGTQQIFEEDPSVLYISLHKLMPGYFPGTGASNEIGVGAGAGLTINVPWRHPEMGDAEYLAAFDAIIMPVARAFDPELVIVSAGFDAAKGDLVGGMAITPLGFAAMTSRLRQLAGGRILMVLEGGYKPVVASKGVQACLRVLLDDPSIGSLPPNLLDSMNLSLAPGASKALSDVLRIHASFWPTLKEVIAELARRGPPLSFLINGRNCRDSGPRDSGPRDSGPRDSGPRDSGPRDSGLRDGISQRDIGPIDSQQSNMEASDDDIAAGEVRDNRNLPQKKTKKKSKRKEKKPP